MKIHHTSQAQSPLSTSQSSENGKTSVGVPIADGIWMVHQAPEAVETQFL